MGVILSEGKYLQLVIIYTFDLTNTWKGNFLQVTTFNHGCEDASSSRLIFNDNVVEVFFFIMLGNVCSRYNFSKVITR